MKIPADIKHKMHMAANHFAKGVKIMKEVDAWFEDKGINSEDIRSGDGFSLEEIEYGNDVTDKFCEWFENQYNNELE